MLLIGIAAPLSAGALVFAFAGGTLNAYLPAAVSVPLMTAAAFPFLATVGASQVLQLVAAAAGLGVLIGGVLIVL